MSYGKKSRSKSRSPLTATPLRHAGQSLDEEIGRVLEDDVDTYLSVAAMVIVLALHEWWRWYVQSPPSPVVFSVIAVGVIVIVLRKLSLARRRLKTLRLGRDGEKAVGQFLESFREKGYRVLHDIKGDNFNIDHLLVGPKGVFTVETKTMSKPEKGEPKIDYDGTQILMNGFKADRDPIIQAKAQAFWVKELIKDLTGKSIRVRPTVVYPGWFINPLPKGIKPEVWVLNPKALPAFIENGDATLTEEEVRSFTSHLSRYVRNIST